MLDPERGQRRKSEIWSGNNKRESAQKHAGKGSLGKLICKEISEEIREQLIREQQHAELQHPPWFLCITPQGSVGWSTAAPALGLQDTEDPVAPQILPWALIPSQTG